MRKFKYHLFGGLALIGNLTLFLSVFLGIKQGDLWFILPGVVGALLFVVAGERLNKYGVAVEGLTYVPRTYWD